MTCIHISPFQVPDSALMKKKKGDIQQRVSCSKWSQHSEEYECLSLKQLYIRVTHKEENRRDWSCIGKHIIIASLETPKVNYKPPFLNYGFISSRFSACFQKLKYNVNIMKRKEQPLLIIFVIYISVFLQK